MNEYNKEFTPEELELRKKKAYSLCRIGLILLGIATIGFIYLAFGFLGEMSEIFFPDAYRMVNGLVFTVSLGLLILR